jgi:hypothetical protein
VAPAQPPVLVRPALPARVPPATLARRVPTSPPTPAQPVQRRTRRPWPKLAWLAVVALSLLAIIGGTFTFLLLTGQDKVIAWMVVGCVLVVVFGTPLLCVVGLVVFYFWALSRVGRARTIPTRSKPAPAAHRDDPVVWGEVVFDD